MLEIIIHDTLIEPGGTDGPLFKLTHDTLASLFCHTWNVTFCACVLETQIISIFDPNVL